MLLSFLRHFSIRIWITLLLGGVVSLLVLPMLQARLGLGSNIFAAATIVLFFFLVTGWGLNRWALNSLDYLMSEAGAFERDGMFREAENAYQKAVGIFDSFMISPLVKQKKVGELGARLARFYLARNRRDHISEDFLVSYLKSNPQDEEVAEHWLHQLEGAGGLKEEHQELAVQLGDAQPKNKLIQNTLARFYLLLERTDFSALQTYRRVYEDDESADAGFVDDLARLFLNESRADEWALAVYLQALSYKDGRTEYLKGLAACVRWTPATERNHHLLQTAHQYLNGIDAYTLEKMRAGFNPPAPIEPSHITRNNIKPGALLIRAVLALCRCARAIVRWIGRQIQETARLIQRSTKAKRVLVAILLFGLAVGVGAMVVNTVSHLAVKEPPGNKDAPPPVEAISDPFTLQVAAYLKPENAKIYVRQLKKQGIDAYWSEAVQGEKKWYQVRVSHFATKQTAREYGGKAESRRDHR